ncbi:MAG: large ribosomal subunit protein bL35 [bacterium]
MKQKIKTLSALKKRIKRTAKNKYLHRHSGTSHNMSSKNNKRKRRLHRATPVNESHTKAVKKLVPYL